MIRAAGVQDAARIAEIFAASMPHPWSEDEIVASLSGGNVFALVWEEAATAVGTVLYQVCLDEAEILNIAVLPSHRRRGIAAALLKAALSKTPEIRTVFLEVRAKNSGAVDFYNHFGFSAFGVRQGYYKAPPDDAICMKFVNF